MKQFLPFATLSALMLAGQATAFTPIQGFYVGAIAEMSHGPDTRYLNTNTTPNIGTTLLPSYPPNNGMVYYDPVGGGGGVTLGYRIRQFRLEGEILYNRLSADVFRTDNCTLQSPTLLVPNASCPVTGLNQLGFNGSVSTLYGMANVYFDFMRDSFDVSVVPYVGLGLGGAQFKNSVNFVNQFTQGSYGTSTKSSTSAAQAIGGLNLFIDDYTWLGMDLRYLTTNGLSVLNDTRFGIISLNFMINFSLDKGYPKG